jgi:hypothetical protein
MYRRVPEDNTFPLQLQSCYLGLIVSKYFGPSQREVQGLHAFTSLLSHACVSACKDTRSTQWTDFQGTLYWRSVTRFVGTFQLWSKSGRNNGHYIKPQRSWLRHYATSRKVEGSSPDEVDFSIYVIFPAALWPWGRLCF